LLVVGVMRVKRGDVDGHRRAMVAALATSALFLVSYVVHHALHGTHGCGATGAARTLYVAVLWTHTPLAAVVSVLAPGTARLGFRDERARHRGLAKWTFPIWLYVSVTGVAIYVMAYQLWPKAVTT